MKLLHFFQSLPAVVGVIAFFAFLWVGQTRLWGKNLREIVLRLRNNPNLDIPAYEKMSALAVLYAVSKDAEVRATVNEQDYRLLKLLSIFQATIIVVVFVVCAGMVIYSVSIFRQDIFRPKPLLIDGIHIKAIEPEAGGLLVDLDPIQVVWDAQGEEKEVSVFLENTDTKSRTQKKSTISSRRFITFEAAEFRPVLPVREYKGVNHFRAVIETNDNIYKSLRKPIFVGVEVELIVQFLLIGSENRDRKIDLLTASINGWTQEPLNSHASDLPDNYCISGIFTSQDKSGSPMAQSISTCNEETGIRGEIKLDLIDLIDWNKPYKFTYYGPGDRRLVRTQVLVHG